MNTNKYYTIINLDKNDLGYKILELHKLGITLTQSGILFRDQLADLGIHIVNKSNVPYTLTWIDKSLTEDYIIYYLKNKFYIELQEITAKLDLNTILNKLIVGNNGAINSNENLNSLIESVIFQSRDKRQLSEKVTEYIDGINTSYKKLYITDPYLFKGNPALISKLLKHSKASKIVAYTSNIDYSILQYVKNQLGDIDLEVVETDVFHDRFWICPENKNGFVLGTSLNGLGNKIALIDYISKEDVDSILSYISNNISN